MILSKLILEHYHEAHKAIKDERYLKYIFKGGRNSGKSFNIGIELILDLMKNPITILCIRKVGNTLQESCYEQLKEAISYLNVGQNFEFKLSPLKIIYKPRGNSIIFRGADDPTKIKSIKKSDFPIATLWIEELAEFKTEDEVTTIENSILRAMLPGGLRYKIFYSYNPPKRKQSWVNRKFETSIIPENVYINHSTYLQNNFVSNEFVIEAEHVRQVNKLKYEWDYLGKPIGAGVVPFSNLEFREISDEEVKQFDNIRQGIDWGYSVDPFHFTRLHYDKTRRKIYIFDEIQEVQLGNRAAAERIKNVGYNDVEILADSAEPKSIAELRSMGLRIFGAKKGPGSVEHGEKWLNELEAIVIDPKRCPKTTLEFETIDYMVDRYGDAVARLEDKNNHSIDAVRYALSKDMKTSVYSF